MPGKLEKLRLGECRAAKVNPKLDQGSMISSQNVFERMQVLVGL
jgi:hypothetical protein